MSRNDAGDDLCPGCGRPRCPCTPHEVRAQLAKDRAEMSDRLAEQSAKCNDYLLEIARLRRIEYAASEVCRIVPPPTFGVARHTDTVLVVDALRDTLHPGAALPGNET